jgi:polyhydroxyalkanoate synthesis regulator phasin
VRDTVAEMAARAHEISLEAGSKMAAAMKDVINAAAGLTGFAVESARDLVQYMVRRGQMTQDEADKLIREAEEAHGKRNPGYVAAKASAASTPAAPKPAVNPIERAVDKPAIVASAPAPTPAPAPAAPKAAPAPAAKAPQTKAAPATKKAAPAAAAKKPAAAPAKGAVKRAPVARASAKPAAKKKYPTGARPSAVALRAQSRVRRRFIVSSTCAQLMSAMCVNACG